MTEEKATVPETPAPEPETPDEAESTHYTNGELNLTDDEVIAQRSADIHSASAKGGEHVKVFVLGVKEKPTVEAGFDHEPNKAATRQYAISAGMRPVGDVDHISTKRNAQGFGWDLTYSVPVAVDERLEVPSGPDIVSDGPSDPADVDLTSDDKPTA